MASDKEMLLAFCTQIKLHQQQFEQDERSQSSNKRTERVAWTTHMELSLSYKYVNFSFKQGQFEDDPQAAWG